MTRIQMKELAKEKIKGKVLTLFLISFVISLVSGAIGAIPALGQVASIFVVPCFTFATTLIYLELIQDKTPEVGDAFKGFSYFWISFKVGFLSGLFVFLWSLLLIIPGIIKAFAYSQAMYIIAENPEMNAMDALKRSEEMMKGHKMELFMLGLSFIGWILLGMLTLGLLYIWLLPYMSATMAIFYNNIKPAAQQ